MQQIGVKEKFTDGVLTLSVTGEIDHHGAKPMREEMDGLIAHYRARVVAIDLSGVDFMDSSGLGLVLGRYTKVRETGGTLRIVGASPRTAKILTMSGVDKIISINA